MDLEITPNIIRESDENLAGKYDEKSEGSRINNRGRLFFTLMILVWLI